MCNSIQDGCQYLLATRHAIVCTCMANSICMIGMSRNHDTCSCSVMLVNEPGRVFLQHALSPMLHKHAVHETAILLKHSCLCYHTGGESTKWLPREQHPGRRCSLERGIHQPHQVLEAQCQSSRGSAAPATAAELFACRCGRRDCSWIGHEFGNWRHLHMLPLFPVCS